MTLTFGATLCFVDHPSLVVGDYLADVIEWNQVNFPLTFIYSFLTLDGNR